MRLTCPCPLRVPPSSGVVEGDTVEVVRTEDFEAVMSWVIGVVDLRLPFSFATLEDPHRLVIDVHDRDS